MEKVVVVHIGGSKDYFQSFSSSLLNLPISQGHFAIFPCNIFQIDSIYMPCPLLTIPFADGLYGEIGIIGIIGILYLSAKRVMAPLNSVPLSTVIFRKHPNQDITSNIISAIAFRNALASSHLQNLSRKSTI